MKYLSLIVVMLLIGSCGEKDPLIKTWKLVEISMDHAFSDYPKEERELMTKVYKQAFQGLIDKRKMTFKDHNRLEVESPDAKGKILYESGTWTKPQPDQIITTIDGRSDTLIIISVTGERLVLRDKQDPDQKQLIFLKD